MSSRPPPKPKVLNPIDSKAQLPARIIRSAQEIFLPYFCLIGQSKRRALSRLTLSGQLLRGGKRCAPPDTPPTTVTLAVGACAMPCHPDEEPSVVTVIGGPPILRVSHQRIKVLLQSFKVEFLEFISVVELLAHRIGQRGMLVQNIQVQLVRPPVSV